MECIIMLVGFLGFIYLISRREFYDFFCGGSEERMSDYNGVI
jgi:hypothetical protein